LNILFICTGNTCRSPLAQVLLERSLADKGLKDIQVVSAGIAAIPGSPASQGSQEVLLPPEDLSAHRARQVDEETMAQADLVLTMTIGHKQMLTKLFPRWSEKIFTLNGYAGYGEKDIADPFGGNRENYLLARREIQEAVENVARYLAKKDVE